jgi:fibronectin-binding autotransporter adhesin
MKPRSITSLANSFGYRHSAFVFVTAIVGLVSNTQVQGAVKTWQGNVSANLSGATNYTTANAPVTGDSFVFGTAGSQGSTLTNGLAASFSTVGITFNSGAAAYTMSGNAMVLAGSIINNSTALQTINFNLSTTAVRTITTNTGGITLGGNISGALGGITKTGSGTLILGGTNSYTGATTVSAGTLNITGAGNQTGAITINGGILQLSGAVGTITASSGIVVNQSGTFTSDNATTNNNARIADTIPIALNGGRFTYIGNSAGASADSMGVFTLSGPSVISVSTTSVSGRAQIAANRLNYTAGTGAVFVNGEKLGSQTANTAGVTQITSANAPTLVGTTAGASSGIASGVYNTQIVPFLLGEATATTGGLGTATGSSNTFVTYSATGGLRPLNLTDEFDTSTTLITGNNVRVTGATTVDSDIAVNSMILDGAGVSINDGFTLTNTSGALMFSSTNSIIPTGTSGALAFDSAAAQITVLPTFTGTISAGISGTGGLVKNGTGNLVLSGSTGGFTGPSSINGGVVSFTGGYTLSDSASALIVNNPNRNAGNAVTLNLSTTIPSSVGSLSGTQSTPSSGTNTSTINNGGQLLTVTQATSGTYDGIIEGAGGLTKSGPALLTLISNIGYSGATTVSAGTLFVDRRGASGDNTINLGSSVTVAGGATLQINALGTALTTSTITAPIALTGNGTVNSLEFPNGNNQTIAVTGGISVSGGATIRSFGLINNYTYSTVGITGNASTHGLIFRMEGGNQAGNTHNVNFNVASTYTGDTRLDTVSQRTNFNLGVNDALPTTTRLTLVGGGNANTLATLNLNGMTQTLAGLTTTPNAGGAVVINTVATAASLIISSTTNQTVAGRLGGGAANNNNFTLTKTGTGILSLSGTNTFTGATAVNGGTLSFLNTGAKSASAVTVASGATLGLGVSAASLPFSSSDVDSLFAGTLSGVTNNVTSNVGIDTTGGNFNYTTAVSSNTRGLSKLGANTLTLSGASAYTGSTTVQAGTLALAATGSINSTSGIAIASGATYDVSAVSGYTVGNTQTLSGAGNVTGAVILAGTHSPGAAGVSNGVGSQTFSSTLNYDTGSIFEWNLNISGTADPGAATENSGTFDQVVANGAITGGAAIFKVVLSGNDFSDAFWRTSKSWNTIFSGAGTPESLASIFSSFSATGGLDAGGHIWAGNDEGYGHFSFDGSSSTLNWTPIPEPSSALAGLLLAAGLLRRRRA